MAPTVTAPLSKTKQRLSFRSFAYFGAFVFFVGISIFNILHFTAETSTTGISSFPSYFDAPDHDVHERLTRVEKQIEQLQAGIASTTGSDSGATLKKLQQQMELLQSQEQRQQEAKSSASQQQQQLPAKKAPPMPFASTNPRKLEKDSNNNHTNTKKKKMNIVLLYADDWTYKTLGKINPYVQTPNLDKLADKGVMFTHNCVTTSICWMSRATLITGQYVSTHKNMWPQDGKFYEDWNNTLFGQMAANGYHNALFGKWHNGMNDKYLKQSLHSRRFYYGYHINDKGKHITQENEDHAMEFLKSKPYKKKPFFLTVSFFATHAVDGDPKQYYAMNSSMSLYTNENVTFPSNGGDEAWKRMPYFIGDRCEGRARWKKRYLTLAMFQHHMKNMYRMATEVDTACGNIIAELERQGIRDNTMIIFTTDNGNFHSEHGMSEKWFPHEESIRVPLIVWDPRMDRGKAGMVNDDFTLNVDLAPTILSAAGIYPPPTMQGRDFAPLYLQDYKLIDEPWRDEFFYEWPSPFGPPHGPAWFLPQAEALVRKDFKYMHWPEYKFDQLFDLKKDSMEENDIVNTTEHADLLVAMKARFLELKAAVTKKAVVVAEVVAK